jgi:hypothetical protein
VTDEVANLVLEQLRLIRADIQRIDGKVDAVEAWRSEERRDRAPLHHGARAG